MRDKDRLPAYFLKGVWRGLVAALLYRETLADPLEPMPTVAEWLDAHGGTAMDAEAFDRCETEWHALLERRERQTDAFLAGAFAGTCVYVALCLGALMLVGWLVWRLIS